MELKFFGIGSCFNTELGNTSAFLKEDKKLLLIDCGEDIFSKIKKCKILDQVESIDVLITHTHSDHCGSLPTLIFFCRFEKNQKPIYIIDLGENTKKLIRILDDMGVNREFYSVKKLNDLKNTYSSFSEITTQRLTHRHDTNSNAFYFKTSKGIMVYTGDTNDITTISALAKSKEVYQIYTDTSGADYVGNVHLSLQKLIENIKPEDRKKIYCMHIDEAFDKKQAKESGFHFAETVI